MEEKQNIKNLTSGFCLEVWGRPPSPDVVCAGDAITSKKFFTSVSFGVFELWGLGVVGFLSCEFFEFFFFLVFEFLSCGFCELPPDMGAAAH